MKREIAVDYEKFIDIFNSQGKAVAKEFLNTSYNLKYEPVIRMLKKKTNYRFNRKYKKILLNDS